MEHIKRLALGLVFMSFVVAMCYEMIWLAQEYGEESFFVVLGIIVLAFAYLIGCKIREDFF